MIELLKILLSLSISGSLMILLLFFCKPLFREKIIKQWQYYIWLIVIARLLLPFATETNLMGSVFQQIETNPLQTVITSQPELDNSNTNFLENDAPAASNEMTTDEQPQSTTPVAQTVFNTEIPNIGSLWLIVAVALFIRKVTVYQSFVKYRLTLE